MSSPPERRPSLAAVDDHTLDQVMGAPARLLGVDRVPRRAPAAVLVAQLRRRL